MKPDEFQMPICASPLDTSLLTGYWLSELAGPEEDAVEEHLLACDECGIRLAQVVAIAEGICKVARQANVMMVLSDGILRRALAEGLRVRQYAPLNGGSVACTVSADDDMLVARLAADLAEAGRVDLVLCGEDGKERSRLRDIPAPSRATDVLLQEPIEVAKSLPTGKLIARLVAVENSGTERILGEYTFNHKRTID